MITVIWAAGTTDSSQAQEADGVLDPAGQGGADPEQPQAFSWQQQRASVVGGQGTWGFEPGGQMDDELKLELDDELELELDDELKLELDDETDPALGDDDELDEEIEPPLRDDELDDETDPALGDDDELDEETDPALGEEDELEEESEKALGEEDEYSRHYQRDRVTDWVATALREAGRDKELQALYESEARATGSFVRLVNYLIGVSRFEDAERWAREGIAATAEKYPGIGSQLAASLCELARKRKQWDIVAAHAAQPFFERPSISTFDEMVKAARKAGAEEPVRAAALRFLETGAGPYQAAFPPPAVVTPPYTKASVKRRPTKARPAGSSPEPKVVAPARMKIDPAWPLPMPDYLIPLLNRPGRYDPGPRPHLEVLLDMAIAANRPDEVLRWFDRMRTEQRRPGYTNSPSAYADRVAVAVSAAYPGRALEIYLDALNAQLPHAQQSAYEAAVGYLKKLRPIYEALDRAGEWTTLLGSIREKYRNRPRFMELLDRLDGRTIVQSTRTRRK